MTRLAVGRAFDGLDVDPDQISFDGERLSMSGAILASSYGVLQATRDRIVALTNNEDEKAVPVTFTEDPSIDGFYRPVSSSCVNYPHSPSTGHAQWSIDLERVGGGPTPQIEVYGFHSVRTNQHSITDATLNGGDRKLIGIPASAIDFYGDASGVGTGSDRDTASGDVTMVTLSTNAPFANVSTFSVPVADAYVGACHIRTTYDTATSQLVGGHHAPGLFGDGWIMSNDLIRVSAHATSTALKFEVYDGTQWEDLAGGVGWRLEHDYGGGSNVQWEIADSPVSILRNSPEACTLRIVCENSRNSGQFGRVWIDLTVKRGDRMVRGVARCDTMGSLGGVWALEPTSSIASTSITGALRATSNDAAGNRAVWGVAGTPVLTVSGTTGRITQNTGTTVMPWFVGVELAGSGSSGLNDDQEVAYQYYDVRNEAQRMVRR